jgi:hypothetical protein
VANDPHDIANVELIRIHLAEEAARFRTERSEIECDLHH